MPVDLIERFHPTLDLSSFLILHGVSPASASYVPGGGTGKFAENPTMRQVILGYKLPEARI